MDKSQSWAMVRVAVLGAGTLGIKIAGILYSLFFIPFTHIRTNHQNFWRYSFSGSLAYGGHEVRVHDQNSAILNKVSLRINEDKRILKEDGLIAHTNFLV